VVGAIPHFEFTREYGVESLHIAFRLAKVSAPLDIHCDEIDDEQSRFVETVAALAERGIGPRVTASHTTAMHSYNGAYTSRLFRLLKLSGINLSLTRWSIFTSRGALTTIQSAAVSPA
jgi:cytosine deaminase